MFLRRWTQRYTLVIPATKRQRHTDPWGPLANQPALIGKVQASERACLEKDKVDNVWEMTPRMSAGLTHMCTQVYVSLHAHKYLRIYHTHTHTKIICGYKPNLFLLLF